MQYITAYKKKKKGCKKVQKLQLKKQQLKKIFCGSLYKIPLLTDNTLKRGLCKHQIFGSTWLSLSSVKQTNKQIHTLPPPPPTTKDDGTDAQTNNEDMKIIIPNLNEAFDVNNSFEQVL